MFSLSEFSINDVSDIMLKERLKKKASELGMSEEELIEKFISDGLDHMDGKDNFSTKNLNIDEIKRILSEDKINDAINGIEYNQGSIQGLLDIINSRNSS